MVRDNLNKKNLFDKFQDLKNTYGKNAFISYSLLIQASTGGRFLGVHSIGVINYIFVESLWNID